MLIISENVTRRDRGGGEAETENLKLLEWSVYMEKFNGKLVAKETFRGTFELSCAI